MIIKEKKLITWFQLKKDIDENYNSSKSKFEQN